jgi:outer membrane autotransporter protein
MNGFIPYRGAGGGGEGGNGRVGDGSVTLSLSKDVTGGQGGNGGFPGMSGGDAGSGGDGGDGVRLSGTGRIVTSGAITIHGGNGGGLDGANSGGNGGAGISVLSGGSIEIGAGTSVTGGRGGLGYTNGNGGAGISMSSGGSIEIEAGASVTGGDAGYYGLGGRGIVGAGLDVTVAGSVTGVGGAQATAIEFTGGTNTLTLQKGYSFTGKIVVDTVEAVTAGTLALGGGSDAGGAFLLSALGDQFQNFASLRKTGDSTWSVTGTPTSFTGSTFVDGGKLLLDNTTLGSVIVNNSGTLGSFSSSYNPSVSSLNVKSGGTLSLGVGETLVVTAGATFESGSTYLVGVDDGGGGGLVYAGVATLAGHVLVDAAGGTYDPTTEYTIVRADAVMGDFLDAKMDDNSSLIPNLHYSDSTVWLTFALAPEVSFVSLAQTPNQTALATVLDGWSQNPFSDLLVMVSDTDKRAAYTELSGVTYASAQTALLEDGRFVRDAMEGRLLGASDQSVHLWSSVYGGWSHKDGDENAPAMAQATGGALFGGDTAVGQWQIGLLGGVGGASIGSVGTTDAGTDYHAGLYAGTRWGNVRFRAGAAFTHHDLSMRRQVSFGDFDNALTSRYGAEAAQGFGELGYELDVGAAHIEPFINLANVALHTEGFTETGGDAALTGSASSDDITLAILGVHGSTNLGLGGVEASAHGMLGWQHAIGDGTPTQTLQFAAGGAPFTVAGLPVMRNAVILKAGVDLKLSPTTTLSFNGDGQIAGGALSQTGRITLSGQF